MQAAPVSVYLDHNATTPLCDAAEQAMFKWLKAGVCANASSVHRHGRAARSAVETAREQLSQAIGAPSKEIIFTGGATEANNMALRGFEGHLVTSAAEHPSVLQTVESLNSFTVVEVERDGRVDPERLEAAFTAETRLCSVMWANNETGAINPIADIADVCNKHGVLLHVDAVQALGKLPINLSELGCSLATFSGHKVYGPLGVGALWVKRGAQVSNLVTGGHQERGRRPGTENTAAIVGFGAAASNCSQWLSRMPEVALLRDKLWEGLSGIGGVERNGSTGQCLPNTLNVRCSGVEGETLLMSLDMAGVMVSVGSACTAGSLEPSHVLLAMGLTHEEAQSSVRFSLGTSTTEADIEFAIEQVEQSLLRMRHAA